MPAVMTQPIGKIVYSESVLAKLAGMAAMDCYGIVGMSSQKAGSGIAELLKIDVLDKGVKVSFNNNAVTIDLYVVIGYGTSIATVADNVIETVKYKVEAQTGLSIAAVNVNVVGVRV